MRKASVHAARMDVGDTAVWAIGEASGTVAVPSASFRQLAIDSCT